MSEAGQGPAADRPAALPPQFHDLTGGGADDDVIDPVSGMESGQRAHAATGVEEQVLVHDTVVLPPELRDFPPSVAAARCSNVPSLKAATAETGRGTWARTVCVTLGWARVTAPHSPAR